MPPHTPTGLHHAAAAVDQSKSRRPSRHQLGKLRSFVAARDADLGIRLVLALVEIGILTVRPHRSPLHLVRLWCGAWMNECAGGP